MITDIVARGFELPDAARTAIEAQISRLAKIGLGLVEATLTLELRRNQFIAVISLFGRRVSFHAETQIEADNVTIAVDDVVDKAERQMRKHKDRLEAKRRGRVTDEGPVESIAIDTPSMAEPAVVAMPENFEAKPMSVEEAALQLNLSNNNFIVFRNSHNQDVNVLFKKRNGTLGWIYPED
jgi:putative sigma-54 modulation protein